MASHPSVRMRRADSANSDFYLLEELSKPRACLTRGCIVVWVYYDGPLIREVVLCGHAEPRTCFAATSILIEAAKQLDENVQWMVTCGAAYFRVSPSQLDDELAVLRSLSSTQAVLGEMVQYLQELAREKGLVEVIEQDWARLATFRASFYSHIGVSPCHIVLPNTDSDGTIADFVPIVLEANPESSPLIFTLEGWDFDCPSFQLVADHHLRKVQRELLSDALRRRRTYRAWLKEWMTTWIHRLQGLPQSEVSRVTLTVPPVTTAPNVISHSVDILSFLTQHAETFLDRGQAWHRRLSAWYRKMPFGQLPDAQLEEAIRPQKIREIDFERGVERTRDATTDDAPFTLREHLTVNEPQMISTCLLHIRRMDRLIKPYEELRLRRGSERSHGHDNDSEVRMLDRISRQIVVETMVRGWPSFYLNDKEDRAVFDAWAKEYRSHIWTALARQAEAAGVALELLLEDNIVYDVRFNDDLGCTLQPLMLVDDAAHAQLHGGRAGASAVVSLWSRQSANEMPSHILQLGSTNRERAAQLVNQARDYATGSDVDPHCVASRLRLALACHPPAAGKLILQEWSRRLGRDTSREFKRARRIIEAAELFIKHRYSEAKEEVNCYLTEEPDPVPDAYIIAALSGLIRDEEKQAKLRGTRLRFGKLITYFEELAPRVRETMQSVQGGLKPVLTPHQFEEVERFKRLKDEMDRLTQDVDALESEIEAEIQKRHTIIEQALHSAASVQHDYPALAFAAEKAGDALRATLETQCLYGHWSEAMFRRYADIAKVIEVRGLLDILHILTVIFYRIERDPKKTRHEALDEMHRLSRVLWLPTMIEADFKDLAEEFGKGDWDRLQTHQILSVIREANATCLARMQDILSDQVLIGIPIAESITTRIHVTQTIEAKYRRALEMLLTAKVPLGRAISRPWTVLDDRITDFPEGGRLGFDPHRGTIFLDTDTQAERFPILAVDRISVDETAYIVEIVADPDLPVRINRFASCLAEGLLAVEVEPCPAWRIWRDAMAAVYQEILFTLSNFGYEANLMPEHAPVLSETGEESARRMDHLTPRDNPTIDWNWQDLGSWQALVEPDVQHMRSRFWSESFSRSL